MILINSRLIIVCIRRHTMFHFKEIIRIPIHIRFRRRRQTNHDCIKILENRPVFLKNTAVAFVNNNQIKMCRCKQADAILIFRIINRI